MKPSGDGPIDPLPRCIDHTLLHPEATESRIRQLCREAADFHFANVCVNSSWVRLCAVLLAGTEVGVCTVAGFPLGASISEVKAYEARLAIRDGASEIDMVIDIGALKSGMHERVLADMRLVREAASGGGALLKVILETALLTEPEIITACRLALRAGADFVKTSTGFGPEGATPEIVALLRSVVGDAMGVKAAGGIRDLAAVRGMLAAGATRIGTSAGVAIMRQAAGE